METGPNQDEIIISKYSKTSRAKPIKCFISILDVIQSAGVIGSSAAHTPMPTESASSSKISKIASAPVVAEVL
jgi:hypothetical protein